MPLARLSFLRQVIYVAVSFLLVAFGQPAWNEGVGLIASIGGFALFWRVLLDKPLKKTRFFLAAGWLGSIQAVQLSWMLSHPYLYIYGVVLFCACLTGAQFGFVSLFIQRGFLKSMRRLIALAALVTIFEWSRLFLLSGLAFNPSGLALTGSLYALQLASLGGVYLLSFWVWITNLLLLRAWSIGFNARNSVGWAACVALPYLFGAAHLFYHAKAMESAGQAHQPLAVILVQPAFDIEENMGFQSAEEARAYVMGEWKQIFSIMRKHLGQPTDLIALPENVVPYGTRHAIFPFDQVYKIFEEQFGESALKALPALKEPYASFVLTDQGFQWLVSNAFFAQAIANIFEADVVIGLEDEVQVSSTKTERYSAALYFPPFKQADIMRYEKRVLVPMGEYIPFDCLRSLAARYGIQDSFTCGKSAKVFPGKTPFGASICYEEMYGHLMRENRLLGAELLVNLTNDGWYPDSRLPKQHFDHSRLRTVENGIPLLRACNTGVTGAVDSLGRIVKVLEDDHLNGQSTADSILVNMPTYHYQTLYSRFGDGLIIGLCFFFIALGLFTPKNKE